MTSKDKTGEQLVASIRKSKSGEVARKTATPRTTRKPAAATSTRTAARQATAEQVQQDRYHFGRRVWPD